MTFHVFVLLLLSFLMLFLAQLCHLYWTLQTDRWVACHKAPPPLKDMLEC